MFYYALKTIVNLFLIIAATEIAKRSSLFGGLVASIPLVSVLAIVWLYVDTHDTVKVTIFTKSILWLVLPSLSLFISLPLLLSHGMNFWVSLLLALVIMTICYLLAMFLLSYAGMNTL